MIISDFHNVIGKPKLPPVWTMGYHSVSGYYNSPEKIREIV